MQLTQKELQNLKNMDFDEDFDSHTYENFQKMHKTQKSFDDGTSKKKNYNPKKSFKKSH